MTREMSSVPLTKDQVLLAELAQRPGPIMRQLATRETMQVRGRAGMRDGVQRIEVFAGNLTVMLETRFLAPTPEQARELGITISPATAARPQAPAPATPNWQPRPQSFVRA